MPHLLAKDIEVQFYASGHSDKNNAVGGQAESPARNAVPYEIDVGYAGLQMQTLLDDSMAQLLTSQQD